MFRLQATAVAPTPRFCTPELRREPPRMSNHLKPRPAHAKPTRPGLRTVSCLLVVAGLAQAATPAEAASWLYRRSDTSHTPASRVQIGPQASGGPFFTRPQGAYVQGGYRHMRSNITIQGRVYDDLHVYESWYQTGGQ